MEVDSKKLWSEILKDIKSDLSPANFRTWFSATKNIKHLVLSCRYSKLCC